MGKDSQPKERQRKQLERKLNQRASYDRVLIVSEGSKTEPLYFSEIKSAYRLHTANIEITHCQTGTSPIQVVEYAHDLFINGNPHKRIQQRAFEKVFAVFDRDDHGSYYNALDKAGSLNGKLHNDLRKAIQFQAIASIPCFELWILLHFEEIVAPIHRDEVMARLRQYMPEYRKGKSGIFADTSSDLPKAIKNAEQLAQEHNPYTDPNPYTGVVELVKQLTKLKR